MAQTQAYNLSVSELDRGFGTKVLNAANARRADHTLRQPIVFHAREGEWYLKRVDKLEALDTGMNIEGAGSFNPNSGVDTKVFIKIKFDNLDRTAKIFFV